jgi:hypothetical protein
MITAVNLTEDTINWGLSKFIGSDGARLLAPLGTSPESVIEELEDLEPGGSTPLGEALQDTYKFNDSYLDANPDAAECSANFVLAVTDGYPSSDGEWSNRINGVSFGRCDDGYGECSRYGDADVWPDSMAPEQLHGRCCPWMYHAAPYKHTVHSIAFGLDNPMLGEVAGSSDGIYITAYDEEQLLNAFTTWFINDKCNFNCCASEFC